MHLLLLLRHVLRRLQLQFANCSFDALRMIDKRPEPFQLALERFDLIGCAKGLDDIREILRRMPVAFPDERLLEVVLLGFRAL